MPWLKCLHQNHDTSSYTLSHTEWNSDGFAWKLSQKGHSFPKLLSLCWSSCSFSRQVGKIAINPMSQNMPALNTKNIKSNPDLQGSLYKCINSDWFESCTKCLGFDLWPMRGAATLGKIRLDPFPLCFSFVKIPMDMESFFWSGYKWFVEFADLRRQFDVMTW